MTWGNATAVGQKTCVNQKIQLSWHSLTFAPFPKQGLQQHMGACGDADCSSPSSLHHILFCCGEACSEVGGPIFVFIWSLPPGVTSPFSHCSFSTSLQMFDITALMHFGMYNWMKWAHHLVSFQSGFQLLILQSFGHFSQKAVIPTCPSPVRPSESTCKSSKDFQNQKRLVAQGSSTDNKLVCELICNHDLQQKGWQFNAA